MIPEKFFVTSGKATSPTSELNAFDLALKEAGIAQCNLVHVSSILPPNCQQVDLTPIPIGAITHVVMARMDGAGGERISAGIAWSFGAGNGHGIVAEASGHMDEKELKNTLRSRVREMARARDIEMGKISYRRETLDVPSGSYGCVMAALVYL
jgi:arginine decarboxylase